MGWSFSPLDKALGLLPQGLTPRLAGQIVRLGVTVSFGEARELLRDLSGVEVSTETVRRLTEAAGRGALALEAAEAAELARSLARPAVQVVDRLQQVSVDGAMVPLVHGEWAEVKTVAIGRIERTAAGPKARELSYFSRLADHERFSEEARIEFHRRATEEAREVVAVNDGAEWIQGFLDEHCPDALRIIDWGHASSYVVAAGQELFGPGTADCSAWLENQLHTLWAKEPELVVEELARLEAPGREAVRTARHYLEKRIEQLRYARFRAAGYPVGSGIVESANKGVVEDRLKGRGRHWARGNIDPIVALRCTLKSDRWQARSPAIIAGLRRPHRRRPPAPRPASAPPPEDLAPPAPLPPPVPTRGPTIVDGKPTREHPWNRFPACRAKF